MEINCEFSEPINLNSTTTPDWEYSRLNCQYSTSTVQEVGMTLISEGEDSFYLSSKMTYGDVVLIFFGIVFLGAIIFSALWNFVHLLIIRWKKL